MTIRLSDRTGRLFIAVFVILGTMACEDDPVDALQAIPVDETLQISGLSAPVRVYRTELNVPHIFATNALVRGTVPNHNKPIIMENK